MSTLFPEDHQICEPDAYEDEDALPSPTPDRLIPGHSKGPGAATHRHRSPFPLPASTKSSGSTINSAAILVASIFTGPAMDLGERGTCTSCGEHCYGSSSYRSGGYSSGNHTRSTSSPPIPYASSERYVDKRRVFGSNYLPEKRVKTFSQLMWAAFNDKGLVFLTIAATASLALGLYRKFGQPHKASEPRVEWVNGTAIMTAVVIVIVVRTLNDYQKEQQFVQLNERKADRRVRAIRSGKITEISVYDVLVGDVLRLESGDLVPADGVFISGHNVKCDESSVTGESNPVKKSPGNDVMARIKMGASDDELDPLIISGSKVLEGAGKYLVTGVGPHSTYGKAMMASTEDSEATPLETKLAIVAEQISVLAGAVALLLFIILFIKFVVQL